MSSSRREVNRRPRPVIEHPTYRAPHYHSRVGGRLIFLTFLVALCAVIGISGGLYYSLHKSQGSSNGALNFHVGTGDTVTTVANRLQSAGLINSSLLFRVDARIQSLSSALKVGDYQLRRNMSIDDMIAALQVYHSNDITIVIPEGLRLQQIARRLQSQGIDSKSFLQEALHPQPAFLNASILAAKPRGASLEGFLFPNTYKVPRGYTGRDVARYMVQQLSADFTPRMRASARSRGLSIYAVLTLASIVEREAEVSSERPIIAGVYYNRLQQKIPLGADPTVQYASGRPGNWWPVLQQQARLIDPASPFNTYTHLGLPPTPIANPGLSSIFAAVAPARTPYLYFVAKGNGHHAFATTLDQQNANIAKYQH